MTAYCMLLAEPSLRKRSDTYLPKYLRIPNALRPSGQNPQGRNAHFAHLLH